jgi:two-component system, chemotaxis family, protein-glutamate methylesterase/glutaminase
LDDIIAVLRALAKPVPAVVMVVLHRPSDKISSLREILARACDLPVVIASEAESLKPGVCYLGEPDGHLTLMDKRLAHLVPGSGHRLRNGTIDVLFNSLAAHAAERAIGIVLSGVLDDGARGLAAIHAAGGMSMVLEPGSKPRGMQQNAINYGAPIGFVGTAEAIAARVGQVLDKFRQQRR